MGGVAPTGGGSAGVGAAGAAGAAGGAGVPNPLDQPCGTATVTVPQRLVRLTNAQVINSIVDLLEPRAVANALPEKRVFMQLFEEGSSIDTTILLKSIRYAEDAAATVPPRFTAATNCPAGTATDACVRTYLSSFARKAFRRPVTTAEVDSLMQVYTATRTGGTPEEGVTYAIEAVLTSPGFLYRTELGAAAAGVSNEVRLTGPELASLLSYVLLDGPPDQALLDAAAANGLATEAGLADQVNRMLAMPGAQANLVGAMEAFLSLSLIDNVPKSGQYALDLNGNLRNAMYTETELFLKETLWHRKVDDLLRSRSTFVNRDLAAFYGVAFPGAPTAPLDQFLPVEAPPERPGLLTQASIMASQARTENTSVVARGLFVNSRILCGQQPPEPNRDDPVVADGIDMQLMDMNSNERQKSVYRTTTSPCLGCHRSFDAFGLVLENFDAIGRFRTTYPGGVAIDASGVLPGGFGGAAVADAAAFAASVTALGAFSRCMTLNFTRYALTQVMGGLDRNEAGVCSAHKRFQAGDGTFASLLREILVSRTVTVRSLGGGI